MTDPLPPARPERLIGGVVAFEEEGRLQSAVDSLLAQRLPDRVEWEELRIVVGLDDEPTATVARECAGRDRRVVVLYEAQRRGKSAALAEILDRGGGDYFVLLNGDAQAAPGAVANLIEMARSLPRRPCGVMGRPMPSMDRIDVYTTALEILWAYHHRFHEIVLSHDGAPHLSDELLLLSAAEHPHLPSGIVNDGAYLAFSIREASGSLGYAPTAYVRVAIPRTWIDHLRQRRRILWGHLQTRDTFGQAPGTFALYATHHPAWALRVMWEEASERRLGFRATLLLVAGELLAAIAAMCDQGLGRHSHEVWRRVAVSPQ